RRSAALPLSSYGGGRRGMRAHGLATRKAPPHFFQSGAGEWVAQVAQKVVREGHAFEGGTGLELAMEVGRHIADLNHDRHAISILACGAHVNPAGGMFRRRASMNEDMGNDC